MPMWCLLEDTNRFAWGEMQALRLSTSLLQYAFRILHKMANAHTDSFPELFRRSKISLPDWYYTDNNQTLLNNEDNKLLCSFIVKANQL